MMLPAKTLQFNSGFALANGIKQLHWQGCTPRQLLFLAFDQHGGVKLQVLEGDANVDRIKVGHKLSLRPPFEGQMFYLDAVHPLGSEGVIINGDRRIGKFFSMIDVAMWLSWFVKMAGNRSVFFGIAPHQPGSWWVEVEHAEPLHSLGFVDIVVDRGGLLARRTMDSGLYFLPQEAIHEGRLADWEQLFKSPLGNVLMIERRIVLQRLVLSCIDGLVEVDLSDLSRVKETGRMRTRSGHAVVGRISREAFAVTRGLPMDWGFDALEPAMLVGTKGCSFPKLCQALEKLSNSK